MPRTLPTRQMTLAETIPRGSPLRTWHVHVLYHLDQNENLDVDYLVDDLAEVNTLIQQSFGIAAIDTITVKRLNVADIVPLNAIYGQSHG